MQSINKALIKTFFHFLCFVVLLSTSVTASMISGQTEGALVKEDSIRIYEVDLALESTADAFSKTDFDFSLYGINDTHDPMRCGFGIYRAIYETGVIEDWALVNGDLLIQDGLVKFLKHRWRTRGLSSASYLAEEANLKLTKEGYVVGKIPYFHLFVNDGEPPMLPLYVSFKEHKDSKPIDANSSVGVSAEMWVEVDGWADGVMYLLCNKV